jgi:hypothetical protein
MEEAVSQLPPVVLVAAYAVFWGWEAFYSARPQAGYAGRRRRNLVISVICIAIAAISGTGALWLSAVAAARHWGILNALDLPRWLAISPCWFFSTPTCGLRRLPTMCSFGSS